MCQKTWTHFGHFFGHCLEALWSHFRYYIAERFLEMTIDGWIENYKRHT